MSGFGSQPFGTSSFGVGTPAGDIVPGSGFVPEPDVNATLGINPYTRDYDVDRATEGAPHNAMTAMESQVLLALTSSPGSLPFALPFGDPTLALQKIPANVLQTVQGMTAQALSTLTKAGQIVILGVTVETRRAGLYRVVRWQDTTTMAETTTAAPLTS